MICLICGKTYFQKRTFNTLFKEKKSYRCHSCNKKYQIKTIYQTVPKKLGLLHIYSLFLEKNQFNLTAFNNEISYLFEIIFLKMRKLDTLIWIEELSIEFLTYLDEIPNDIYIITNTPYFT